MIQVHGVCKRFGEIEALKDVSFQIERGEIVGFLGANGAGKTTAMDIMCGCLGADKGFVKIGDQDVFRHPMQIKRRIGYLPDLSPLHNEMTIEEYLRYVARLRGLRGPTLSASYQREIERLSLSSEKKRLIGNLSKGYRRRVGLAQALIHDPDVLILDEPTDGLDPRQIAHIRELIRSLRGAHTIVFSSHILSEVESVCDRIIIIHRGRVVEQGTYPSLVAQIESQLLYRLRIGRDAETFLERLRLIPGVVYSRLLDGNKQLMELGVIGEGVVDHVARLALDGGFGLREIAQKPKTLEDIYFQSTLEKN